MELRPWANLFAGGWIMLAADTIMRHTNKVFLLHHRALRLMANTTSNSTILEMLKVGWWDICHSLQLSLP